MKSARGPVLALALTLVACAPGAAQRAGRLDGALLVSDDRAGAIYRISAIR